MKPAIVYHRDNKEHATLVDLDSVIRSQSEDGAGKMQPCHISLRAVTLLALRAGQMTKIEGRTYPRPCQYIAFDEHVVNDPMLRGIFPDAACAMLKSLSYGADIDLKHDMVTLTNKTGNFDEWGFWTAWHWSSWQDRHRRGEKWTLERRWENLRLIGYPDKKEAFRKVCSRLGLSVTKSRP